MDKEFININGMDMLYLANCGLHGIVPDHNKVTAMDLETVYKMARSHAMTAITYTGLELWLQNLPEKDCKDQYPILATWAEDRAKAVRKNILLDMERMKILSFLESIGCWYMPLKGVYLKDMYPKMGMRQMADNDILFDSAFRLQVRHFMERNGYRVIAFKHTHHDEYEKLPVYNFEMHVSLFNKALDSRWLEYYEDIKDRLIKDEENQCGYHFSDEDFYVYFVLHAYKHFAAKGNGVRFLMDIYVLLSKQKTTLDWEYIYEELEKLGIVAFERSSKSLAKKVFSRDPEELTDEEAILLHYYLGSGAYGMLDQLVLNRLKSQVDGKTEITIAEKVKYLWIRLFPKQEFYKIYAPVAYKYKILIPFAAIWRIICTVFKQGKNIWKEIQFVLWYGKKDSD